MARRAVEAGFDAVKLAPFDEMPKVPSETNDVTAGIAHGLACAEAVRDVLGRRKLLIDAHSRFTLAQGLAILPRFEPLDLYWLEEVTAERGFTDLATITRAARMPTVAGEVLYGIDVFRRYLRVQPASPVGGLAAAHVMVSVPNFTILEHVFGEVPWRAELLDPPEPVASGGRGDTASGNWVAGELALAGYRVEGTFFSVPFFTPSTADLRIGDTTAPPLAQAIVQQTPAEGVTGRWSGWNPAARRPAEGCDRGRRPAASKLVHRHRPGDPRSRRRLRACRRTRGRPRY